MVSLPCKQESRLSRQRASLVSLPRKQESSNFKAEGFYGVIPAQAGIQNFKAEGFYGVTAAQVGMTRNTGLLPRAGMASGAIRLKCYPKSLCPSGRYQKHVIRF